VVRHNKNLYNLLKDDKGNVFILVAIFLVVLLGMTVFAIDVGSLYLNRRQVVNAADAAALAGAQEIIRAHQDGVTDDGGVRSRVNAVVVEYLGYHDAELIEVTESDGSEIRANSETVRVVADKRADLFFAPAFYALLGSQSAETSIVGAYATAKLDPPSGVKNLVPFTIPDGYYDGDGNYIEYTYTKGDIEYLKHESMQKDIMPGFFGLCAFHTDDKKDPGGSILEERIINGYPGLISVGDVISTEPGGTIGKVRSGVNTRMDNGDTIIWVPIFDNRDQDTSGRETITVVGFASFELLGYCNSTKAVEGRFIEDLAVGSPDSNGDNDSLLRIANLIE